MQVLKSYHSFVLFIVDQEEGSGSLPEVNTLSPEELDLLRRNFYYEYEVDLLRLDTSCQKNYIAAPQIFHAKIK